MKMQSYLKEFEDILTGYWMTDLANCSAFLFKNLSDINWVGFYLSDGKKLRLGPFCGQLACTEISFGKGVCGYSYSQSKTVVVDDVDLFTDHIRCDSNSKSEIVVPVYISNKLIGVLDIDSPLIARFTLDDKYLIEEAVQILSCKISNYSEVKYGSIF